MEKISINVEIPALNGTYDFVVPSNMSIRCPESDDPDIEFRIWNLRSKHRCNAI